MDPSMRQNFYQQQQQQYLVQPNAYPVQHSAGQMYQAPNPGWGAPMRGHLGVPQYQNQEYQAGPMPVGGQQQTMGMNQYLPNQTSGPYNQYQGQQFSAASQTPQGYRYAQGQGHAQSWGAPPQNVIRQYAVPQANAQSFQAPPQGAPQYPAIPYMQQPPPYAGPAQVQANRGNFQAPMEGAAPQIQFNRHPQPQVFFPVVAPVVAPNASPAALSPAAAPLPTASSPQAALPLPAPVAAPSPAVARPVKEKKPRKPRAPAAPKAPKPLNEVAKKRAAKKAKKNANVPVTAYSQAAANLFTGRLVPDWEKEAVPVLPSKRVKRQRSSEEKDLALVRPAKVQKVDGPIDLTGDDEESSVVVAPAPVKPVKKYAPATYRLVQLPVEDTSAEDAKKAANLAKEKIRRAEVAVAAKKQKEEDAAADKIRKEEESERKKEEKKEKQKQYRLNAKAKKEAEKLEREEKERLEMEKELEDDIEKVFNEELDNMLFGDEEAEEEAEEVVEEEEEEEEEEESDEEVEEEITLGDFEIDMDEGFNTYDAAEVQQEVTQEQVDSDTADDSGYKSDESVED